MHPIKEIISDKASLGTVGTNIPKRSSPGLGP